MTDNKPTDDELNRWLFDNVIGGCWHDSHEYQERGATRFVPCSKCGYAGFNPNYCQSLDAVRAPVKVVIEAVGYAEFAETVVRIQDAPKENIYIGGFSEERAGRLLLAEARELAEACYEAMKENMNDTE